MSETPASPPKGCVWSEFMAGNIQYKTLCGILLTILQLQYNYMQAVGLLARIESLVLPFNPLRTKNEQKRQRKLQSRNPAILFTILDIGLIFIL
jgi:hypothetical protein